jgi:hypothetical protein
MLPVLFLLRPAGFLFPPQMPLDIRALSDKRHAFAFQ